MIIQKSRCVKDSFYQCNQFVILFSFDKITISTAMSPENLQNLSQSDLCLSSEVCTGHSNIQFTLCIKLNAPNSLPWATFLLPIRLPCLEVRHRPLEPNSNVSSSLKPPMITTDRDACSLQHMSPCSIFLMLQLFVSRSVFN